LNVSAPLVNEKARLTSVEKAQKVRVDKRVKEGVTFEPACAAHYDFTNTYSGWSHAMAALTTDANELVPTV